MATFTTTDPRGGRSGAVGDVVYFVRHGRAVPMIRYDAPATAWTEAIGQHATPAVTIVTADPRTGGGLAAAVGAQVIYMPDTTAAIWLIKYDAGDTDWARGGDMAPASPPAGSSGQVQYNAAGSLAGASSTEIDASGNPILVASTPTTPAAGRVSLYGLDLAGRTLPAYATPDNRAVPLSPHLGMVRREEWAPNNNANTSTTFGGTFTSSVVPVSRAIAGGSYFAGSRRQGYVSAAGAGSSSSVHAPQRGYLLGDVANVGGFTLTFRWGIGDAAVVANARMFVGLRAAVSAIGNVEPSTLLNVIGVGCDAGAGTLHLMHGDAATAATPTDLGANFPTNTQSTDVYELVLRAKPNATTVDYLVTRRNTGHTATGTISANLPANTLVSAPQFWRNNGATALAVDLAFMGFYGESDN